MLIAGAGASASAYGGALTFDVDTLPSDTWWYLGSAFIYIMLFAGASVDRHPALGGAFPFNVSLLLSNAWWGVGSAPYMSVFRLYVILLIFQTGGEIVDIVVS